MKAKKMMKMMNKCDIGKCKAACCYNVPLEKGYLSAYCKRIVNPVLRLEKFGDRPNYDKVEIADLGRNQYLAVTDNDPNKNKCPFLRDDCKCNIYEQRPVICRRFGQTPNVRFLHCYYREGGKPLTVADMQEGLAELTSMFFKSKK